MNTNGIIDTAFILLTFGLCLIIGKLTRSFIISPRKKKEEIQIFDFTCFLTVSLLIFYACTGALALFTPQASEDVSVKENIEIKSLDTKSSASGGVGGCLLFFKGDFKDVFTVTVLQATESSNPDKVYEMKTYTQDEILLRFDNTLRTPKLEREHQIVKYKRIGNNIPNRLTRAITEDHEYEDHSYTYYLTIRDEDLKTSNSFDVTN